jgi:hypothetical protein
VDPVGVQVLNDKANHGMRTYPVILVETHRSTRKERNTL